MYPDFEESTGYGTVTGLCGVNCRHSFFPFFPGISVPNYTEEELSNIDPPPVEYKGKTYTYYEATQKQRQIERAMRKTKQEMIAYESAGLKDDFIWSAVKLRRQKDTYEEFSKVAGLKTHSERQQLYGFGRSISQKAVQADKKVERIANLLYNDIKDVDYRKKLVVTYSKKPFVQKQLTYKFPNTEYNFIPKFTEFEKNTVKTIAKAEEIREVQGLISKFGGTVDGWEKKVGQIKSDKYIFDVHWYEYDGIQYKIKVKMRNERQ